MCTNNSFLISLPIEIQIQIFSYLDTFDLFQLSKIWPGFEFCTSEKELIRHIRLYREYRLKIADFNQIFKRPRTEIITYLNINCVYWIPASDIRKCLTCLHALECLYAVDTKLSLSIKDCSVYQFLLNLKRIGLTFNDKLEAEALKAFPRTITHLYLHIDWITQETTTKLSYLIHRLIELEELWIIDLSSLMFESTSMRILCMLPKQVKKLTFMVRSVPNIALVNHYQLCDGIISFRSKQRGFEISFEKFGAVVNNIYQNWLYKEQGWDTLINYLKCDLPFSPQDAKLLILNEVSPSSIKFNELNICHSSIFCSLLFKTTLNTIFLESNMHALRKLSVNLCAAEINDQTNTPKEEPLFKRLRRSSKLLLQNLPEKSSVLNTIVEVCSLLQELELWECDANDGCLQNISNASLSVIEKLKHLKKLTLHGLPPHITGQFLLNVCESCQELESLRIQTTKQNNNLSNHLCLALPKTQNLKDLRYEQIYIPIDKFFEALNRIKEPKLERLVIKCKTVEMFSMAHFNLFLQNNSRLRFLCIIITEMPKTVIRNISKVVNQYKDNPEKVYFVTQDEAIFKRRMPIPSIHKEEMLHCNTEVCVIDIFNGFAKF